MSEKFTKKWVEPDRRGIMGAIRPSKSFRSKINQAIRGVETQVQKLEQEAHHLSERDKSMFTKIVQAYTSHNTERATILANELSEIRKMEKFMTYSEIALEQVVLRLKTVSELGDTVVTLAPALNILQSLRIKISGVLPGVENELGRIGTILSEIITESGQRTGMMMDFNTANDEAAKILNEAAIVAEQRMKEKFPELPGTASGGQLFFRKD